MSVLIDTATDAADLYAQLITFLKTDTTLVADGEEWTEVWDHAGGDDDGIVLRGPGLAALDQIYVGMRLVETAPGDSFAIEVFGMTGVIQTATELEEHVNVSPGHRMFLDIAAMDFWFIASGRRFIVITKISTVFESMYAGFFLPYGDPTQYTYPLFIGATARADQSQEVTTWRDVTEAHRAFWFGSYESTFDNYGPSAAMLNPIGEWKSVTGNPSTANSIHTIAMAPHNYGADNPGSWPLNNGFDAPGSRDIGYETVLTNMSPCFDGSYAMLPLTMIQVHNLIAQYYGILDGAFFVEGAGNSSEDIVTVSAVDHLVVQNVNRAGLADYIAVKLG